MKTQSNSRFHVGLFFILLIGFALRFTGSNFGLPYLYHADEPIVVNHALAYGFWDLNPHFFKIPPLISYALFFIYGLYFLGGLLLGQFENIQQYEMLFYSDPSSFYWIARLAFGVVLGTLTIFAFYHLISKYFSKSRGLLCAFFLAVCFLHVRDSHYIYVDIPLVLIIVCSFSVFLGLLGSNYSRRGHWIAGAIIGLAVAVKYNGGSLIIPYITATLLMKGDKKPLLIHWIKAAISGIFVFTLLNPFWILDFDLFWNEIRAESEAHAGGIPILDLLWRFPAEGMGYPLWIASIVGMGRGLWLVLFRRDARRGCFLVFIVSYLLILYRWGQPYGRYWLPLIPLTLFFVADFLDYLLFRKTFYLYGIALILSLPTLAQSILFNQLMVAIDSRTQAKNWIEENIPSGAHVALIHGLDIYMPRLQFSQSQLEDKKLKAANVRKYSGAQIRRLDFYLNEVQQGKKSYNLYGLSNDLEPANVPFLNSKPLIPFQVSELQKKGIEYVVIVRLDEMDRPEIFYKELDRVGEVVAEFNPYRNASRLWAYSHPLTGGPFYLKDILFRERNGQPLKIYKLESEKSIRSRSELSRA